MERLFGKPAGRRKKRERLHQKNGFFFIKGFKKKKKKKIMNGMEPSLVNESTAAPL